MKKEISGHKAVSFGLVFSTLVLLPSFQTVSAEEGIKIDSVRNELLKASIPKPGNGAAATDANTVTESDLEKANKKLKAAEARLLSQSAITEPKAKLAEHAAVKAEAEPVKAVVHGNQVSVPKNFDVDSLAAEKTAEKNAVEQVKAVADESKPKAEVKVESSVPAPGAPKQMAALQDIKPLEIKALPAEELVRRNTQLETDLQAAQVKINGLLKELDDSRNRLMIAETQVERLSSIIESRGKDGGTRMAKAPQTREPVLALPGSTVARMPSKRAEAADDMQIATVVSDKVHLRTGPGKDNSPLMAVTKGTRLAVETRNGDWYRVIAPTGVRAWVSSDVVAFGINGKEDANQATRIKGFNSGFEAKDVF